MMNWTKRLLCVVLALCCLAQTAAAAAPEIPPDSTPVITDPAGPALPTEPADPLDATEPEEPTEQSEPTEPEDPTEPTEPDPLAGYTFPNNWAGEPLKFAVRNGILLGRGDYDLDPTGRTTRAEMAAMLVRLLGATEQGDLTAYVDCDPAAWYWEELGTASSMGIFAGVSAEHMRPTHAITRQEAFTVLARAFGVYPQDPDAYTVFPDSASVMPYARNAVSALYEVGCVSGYETGKLLPRAYISRQEVAALFYKLLDAVCDSPEEIPAEGAVLYRGAQPLPQGLELDGNLYIGAGMGKDVTLDDLTVSGLLSLRCASGTQLLLNWVQAGSLSVASNMFVSGDMAYELIVGGTGAEVALSAMNLRVYAPCTLEGSYQTACLYGNDVTLDGSVQELIVNDGCKHVTLNGTANLVRLNGRGCTLDGRGYAGTVVVTARDCTVNLSHGTLEDRVDWGLVGVTARLTGPAVMNKGGKVELLAVFTGFRAGYGTTNGARPCTLQWYLNGQLLETHPDFLLTEGATAAYVYDVGTNLPQADSVVFTVVLTCGGESVQASLSMKVSDEQWDYAHALEIVQTVNIEAHTLYETKLYKDDQRSQVLRTLPAGTSLTHLYFSDVATAPGKVRLADGTVGWIDWSDYLVSRENYTQSWDYSEATKEGFVNQMGYSSPTDYLIWLSLKTQKVNIFQGSKGQWELIRTFPCATGKNTTPTVSGVYSIIYKTYRWRFSETVNGEYVDDYTRVYHVTGFWGGQAFHSRLYLSEDESLYDGTMGTPVSHGCVRMMDEDCRYIYDNMPYNTTVVNY